MALYREWVIAVSGGLVTAVVGVAVQYYFSPVVSRQEADRAREDAVTIATLSTQLENRSLSDQDFASLATRLAESQAENDTLYRDVINISARLEACNSTLASLTEDHDDLTARLATISSITGNCASNEVTAIDLLSFFDSAFSSLERCLEPIEDARDLTSAIDLAGEEGLASALACARATISSLAQIHDSYTELAAALNSEIKRAADPEVEISLEELFTLVITINGQQELRRDRIEQQLRRLALSLNPQ